MSKYIKLEDAIRNINLEVTGRKEYTGDMKANLFFALDDLPTIEVSEENELKFYYVESIDDYWIGRRLDNFYYAEWSDRLGFVWTHSRYLPWGEHIVDENTLWKEHTYPSEPKEIPFTEWIVGFMKKRTIEDCISRHYMLRALNGYGKDWQEDCEIADVIRNAPSVVPSRAEGEWVFLEWFDEHYGRAYECDLCGEEVVGKHNYCPNCGARMKG